MIFDRIENAGRYFGISRNLDQALTVLLHTDLAELSDGRHPINGENVFMNVMEAVTAPECDRAYEYHIQYYDIQTDIAGKEDVLFGTSFLKMTVPYREDIGFGICGCGARVHLEPGWFVVCEPGEPHLPGVAAAEGGQRIRKAVIKVRGCEVEG